MKKQHTADTNYLSIGDFRKKKTSENTRKQKRDSTAVAQQRNTLHDHFDEITASMYERANKQRNKSISEMKEATTHKNQPGSVAIVHHTNSRAFSKLK